MKKTISLLLAVLLLLSLGSTAFAVNEDVEGELVIFTSMYKEVLPMIDEALKEEFPNLIPGNEGSFFFQGGSNELITRIYGEMGENRDGALSADTDWNGIKTRIREELGAYVWKKTKRRPMILPIIMEVE